MRPRIFQDVHACLRLFGRFRGMLLLDSALGGQITPHGLALYQTVPRSPGTASETCLHGSSGVGGCAA
jgi:hypothetical protein